MDSFRGQGGIQMLLTAEQEAQHIIATARNLRMGRLKQAKDETEKDMALYRSNMEVDYQNKVSSTNSEAIAKRLEKDTEAKIESLKKSGFTVSPEVVAMLIKQVTTVKN